MKKMKAVFHVLLAAFLVSLAGAGPSGAIVYVQCPGDLNGDAVPDPFLSNNKVNPAYDPNVRCMHLAGGDGYVRMTDRPALYMFGFADITGVLPDMAMHEGMLAGESPAPTIVLDEGNEFYLTLTNVGMDMRPDLFDPHTVHWHGFPQAASIFDGVPDASISINMGSSLTYYYKVTEPGTYLYHCHVEALEHMEMGMIGNLYVRPKQNKLPHGTPLNLNGSTFIHQAGYTYAYNDGDGSTYYDVDYPVQMATFDTEFHDANEGAQPLLFSELRGKYPLINGRGYPDTVNPNPLVPPVDEDGEPVTGSMMYPDGRISQKVGTLIQADAGDKILLRISNVSVTDFFTLGALGLTMKVVGMNARLLRGPSPDGGVTAGKSLYYTANSITLGGGESADVILDTNGVSPGTYFLYTTNLNFLSNHTEDFGGIMTEIVIQ